MYVFSTDHLVLDKQLGGSTLGKTNFLSFSSPELLSDLHRGEEEISPIHNEMLIGVCIVQVLFKQSAI